MNSKSFRGSVATLCLLIFAQASDVSAANKTKVWLGTGLIAGGVGLGAHAASNAFCGGFDAFPPFNGDESDDCHQDEEMIAGLALIGAGTFFLIKGLTEDEKKDLNSSPLHSRNQTLSIGFGPSRKGWAGAVRVRW